MESKIEAKMPMPQVSGHGRVRNNFSLQHLLSTVTFCKLAHQHEMTHENDEFGSHFEYLRTYVSSAIMLSFASVEANINEFFLDAPDFSAE